MIKFKKPAFYDKVQIKKGVKSVKMTSNRDLREFQQNADSMQDAFGKLVSGGKSGYKAILEKKEPIFCQNPECKRQIEGHEKFCPGCGNKIEKKSSISMCPKCYNVVHAGDSFCQECGTKISAGQ